ncbi:MAG: MFS transporter [Raoultibacter sp.]
MQEEKLYSRRWAILIAMTCILVAIQFSFILPGGAAVLIMQTYAISPMEFSMVMSIPYLSGFLFAILAGTLADRIGINKVIVGGLIIAFIGSCARALSGTSFILLFGSMFVMGFAMAALNANSAKLLRTWFPGTANSFAMGVYTAGMSAGAAIALWYGSHVTSDIWGAWWFSAALIGASTIIWIALYRKHPDGDNIDREPIAQYLGAVLKNPHVWGISIVAFLVFGMTNVNGTYMVAAITALAGDPSVVGQAGDLSTLNTAIACIASMVLPVVFVAKFKNMRLPVAICLAGTAVCFGLIYFFPYGVTTWVLYIICPIFMASLMPIVKMLPTLLPSVKKEQLGVVGGIQATFQNMGMFLVASYVLSPIATAVDPSGGVAYYQVVYVGVAIVCVVAFLSFFLFPNVRSSVGRKIADEMAAAKGEKVED